MPLSPTKKVYLAPGVSLVLLLAAGAVFLAWNDVIGVAIVFGGLVSVAGLFVKARRRSIEIQMNELRAAERRRTTDKRLT